MRYRKPSLLAALALAAVAAGAAAAGEVPYGPLPLVTYEIDRSVADFPSETDFRTPENAYVSINRHILATGDNSAWARFSVSALSDRIARETARQGPKSEVDEATADMWRNARIVEILFTGESHALVVAKVVGPSGEVFYDLRSLALEGGRWLNGGNSSAATLESARETAVLALASAAYEPPVREAVEYPEAYLKTFTDFLESHGRDPKEFILYALDEHKLVIIGEVHHRPLYWELNSALVRDERFAAKAGVVYMELPLHGQRLVDEFLASETLDTQPVIEMLRDMMWLGWPDKAMLEFFIAVWEANRGLPPEKKIRIVLTDMARPWDKIRKRSDWTDYERVPRDKQMTDNILKDMTEHASDTRNGLFIVGVAHAMLDFRYFEDAPVKSAGWQLRQALGRDEVYAIFPHMPVQTNMGRVDGRLCMGLFDSAFERLGSRAIAFPLDLGPFGAEPFDAMPDVPVRALYRDGYSAYLYLGPLEDEIFSPLIEGFYTASFVRELDRRHMVLFGRSWHAAYGTKPSAKGFTDWMAQDWGRPREKWIEGLGDADEWVAGGGK